MIAGLSAIARRFPDSLRWRLTAWVAAVMLVALAALFVVVYLRTGHELGAQIDHDLTGDTAQLAQAVSSEGRSGPDVIASAQRYLSTQPFSSTSTLLFVFAGGAVASNHLELFGARVPDPGESAAEQAEENARARALLRPRIGLSLQIVPDVGHVRILERALRVGGRTVIVGAGEPLATVERAQHGLAAAFALAAAISLALALIASYLAGARVSAPLRRMAAVATRVDAGELEPRMEVSLAQRGEVRVLAEAFNHMLDRLSEAFASQREFVADASHELRTPLTVIRGQLEVLSAQDQPSGEEIRRVEQRVGEEIARITRLVEDLLVLAQADQTHFLRVSDIELGSFVEDLWEGVSLTARRHFELSDVPAGALRADPDRLAQALRNLARNAIEHTAEGEGTVRLEVARNGDGRVRFAVLDDGPGIPPAERERIFERFHRTDPGRARSAGGAGLGLAIVQAIAEAHGGTVSAGESGLGAGARIELELPGFRPDGQVSVYVKA